LRRFGGIRNAPYAAALIVALLIAFTGGAVATRGDDAAPVLPRDGAWGRYEIEHFLSNGTKLTPLVTLSFVGSVVEYADPSRWVEVKGVIPKGGKGEGTHLAKVLIRERDLIESKDPLGHPLRIWARHPGEPQAQLAKVAFTTGPNLMLWAPGALKTLKESDES